MRKWSVLWAVAALLMGAVATFAAEKFEDKGVALSVELPEAFQKGSPWFDIPEVVGDVKGFFAPKNHQENGAFMMVHALALPETQDFAQFKSRISDAVADQLGATYKLLKQEDVTQGGLSGFLLDFEGPGDGLMLNPNGGQRHRVKWYLFRNGDRKVTGIAYHAQEKAWKELEPKVAASLKTAKKSTEN